MGRAPGLSVRLKLTLSYAGFLLVAGVLLIAVVWVFLLRYVPDSPLTLPRAGLPGRFVPTRSDLWRAFAPRAAQVLALLLVLGLGGGWLLAGRVLAPLRRITEATRAAAGGSLAHRVALPGRRDEFRDLADAFDGMLGRLEAHVAEQERFAANASHELRTPLAISQTMLEVARDDPAGVTPELLDRLQAVNTRAIDLTEALLLLTRAGRRTFDREPVDLSLLAEQAAESLLPLAERRGVALVVVSAAAATTGSPALLLQLTTDLVHNAIVHNLPGGSVRVTTCGSPRAAVLTVDNTGPPLAPESLPALLEPFQRGAARVRTHEHGVGLGLAIVRSITDAHDGTLTLAARAGGGLCTTVALPAAPVVH